jgi:NAD(P)-dependent dehydrogenase (short-subunit alcohol dehydrogenase family)
VIDLGADSSDEERAGARSAPLGRGPDAAEVCRTLRLILASPSMTGQMITLDGGQHLGWLPGSPSGPDRCPDRCPRCPDR